MDPSTTYEPHGEASEAACSKEDDGTEFFSTRYTEERGLQFTPPVYVQRYKTVVKYLQDPRWKDSMHKIVDMGCSELGFFLSLKYLEGVREIVAVDVDRVMLETFANKTCPLSSDFLRFRDHSLKVTVLAGSVAEYDKRLERSDAVVCIELIEHLYPPELDALPYTILGLVKPRIAVFTTPNIEFNVLFTNYGVESGLRHPDHKFEWTRQQFEDWANNLVVRYPEYHVEFQGIGKGPEGTEIQVGCCSQMAVFWREASSDAMEFMETPPRLGSPPHKYNSSTAISVESIKLTDELSDGLQIMKHSQYKVVKESLYPARRDERNPEQIKLHELEYEINSLSMRDCFEEDIFGFKSIPLSVLLPRVSKYYNTEAELRATLESTRKVLKTLPDGQVCVQYKTREESSSEEDYCEEMQNQWKAPSSKEEATEIEDWDLENEWPPQTSQPQWQDKDQGPHSPDSDWDMGEATPRPWQSEPQLQASPLSPQLEDQQQLPLMFRSVNERQIFGLQRMASSPDDGGCQVDDSGYPNSASVQDMDVTLGSSDELSSQDSSSSSSSDSSSEEDEEPPVMPHVPPLPHFRPDPMPANNHDAVNNNRDGEGNDLGLEVVHHQPPPVRPPGPPPFPRWLLLMLAEERDEGFPPSSSDEDDDDEEEEEDRHILVKH